MQLVLFRMSKHLLILNLSRDSQVVGDDLGRRNLEKRTFFGIFCKNVGPSTLQIEKSGFACEVYHM